MISSVCADFLYQSMQDMKSEIPIYLQLRNQIVMGIGKGEFEEGELLPVKIRRIYRDGPQAGNCDLPSRI